MNKLLAIALAVLSLAASAMPTQAQLDEVKPIVQELMAPLVRDYKAKKTLAAEVADGAMALVAEADTEAAKFALIKGAVFYYTRAKAYDKAADAIESLARHIPDIPAPTLYEITSKAVVGTTARTAPRLAALNAAAKKRAAVATRRASVAKELRKTPADLRLLRLDAELAAARRPTATARRGKRECRGAGGGRGCMLCTSRPACPAGRAHGPSVRRFMALDLLVPHGTPCHRPLPAPFRAAFPVPACGVRAFLTQRVQP